MWFRYTAGVTGDVSIDTCGSSFDTVLAAFAACGGAELACDDNSGCGNSSKITFAVTQGTEYRVRVAAASAVTSGNIIITGSAIATGGSRPTNDECANATAVGDGTHAGNNAGATTDGVAVSPCVPETVSPSGRDVWWSYTAPASGAAVLNTLGSDTNLDTVLSVIKVNLIESPCSAPS